MANRNMVLLQNANGISPKIHNGGMCPGCEIYYDMRTGRGICVDRECAGTEARTL
jgi:hypothetical protein